MIYLKSRLLNMLRTPVLLIFIILILCLFGHDQGAYAEGDNGLKIGVLSFDSKEEIVKKWTPLIDYLNGKFEIEKMTFKLVPLFYDELDEAVASKNVDFILTNPAHFIALSQKFNLSGAMATLVSNVEGKPQYEFGGVIFTRNMPGSPETIDDLKGKVISAVAADSLGGYQAPAYELYKRKISLIKDVTIVFTGMPHANAVEKVMGGSADAGFVRTGIIESMIKAGTLKADALRIINNRKSSTFQNYLSTDLYPEWPFVALPHIDQNISKKVAAELLLIDPESETAKKIGIYGFTIPSGYLSVETMMRALKLPPFEASAPITLAEIWETYKLYIIFFINALIFIGLMWIINWKSVRVIKKKNAEINEIMVKLEEANTYLENLSLKDALTGLFNRRYFDIMLFEKINMAKRSRTPLALLIIDLDLFKEINDTYGHPAGDEILICVGQAITSQVLRTSDFVCRYGGDEFVVALYDTTEEGAKQIAEKIKQAVEKIDLCLADGEEIRLNLCIGGCIVIPDDTIYPESIFKAADIALYEAKNKGGNQICMTSIYTEGSQSMIS